MVQPVLHDVLYEVVSSTALLLEGLTAATPTQTPAASSATVRKHQVLPWLSGGLKKPRQAMLYLSYMPCGSPASVARSTADDVPVADGTPVENGMPLALPSYRLHPRPGAPCAAGGTNASSAAASSTTGVGAGIRAHNDAGDDGRRARAALLDLVPSHVR